MTGSFARAPSVPSAIGLVVANVVPLVGVIWFDWSLFGVMWLYWAENGIIGAFALARILTAGGGAGLLSRLGLGMFFTIHFGVFWSVHGVFVATLFGGGDAIGLGSADLAPWEGLVPLVLSHGASFVLNYLVRGERKAAEPGGEMIKPYGRVVILHIVLILGGFAVMAIGGGVLALALFVTLKTGLDLGAHWIGHRMRLDDLALKEPDPEATTIRLDRVPAHLARRAESE